MKNLTIQIIAAVLLAIFIAAWLDFAEGDKDGFIAAVIIIFLCSLLLMNLLNRLFQMAWLDRGTITNPATGSNSLKLFKKTISSSGKSEREVDDFLAGIEIIQHPDGFSELAKPLKYYIGRKDANLQITIPKGFKTDFASIPWAVQWLIEKHGRHNGPAVLHDWLFQTHKVGFRLANAVMYDAMVEANVKAWRRYLIYCAIRSPFGAYSYMTGPGRLTKVLPDFKKHIVR